MIEIVRGDLFSARVDALVNPVNCLGDPGAGLAAAFRRNYPQATQAYVRTAKQGLLRPGAVLVTPSGRGTGPRAIVHFPTKDDWHFPSKLEYVRDGLVALGRELAPARPDMGLPQGIESIAIPALGCGLGELTWDVVRGLMLDLLSPSAQSRTILIFEPHGR